MRRPLLTAVAVLAFLASLALVVIAGLVLIPLFTRFDYSVLLLALIFIILAWGFFAFGRELLRLKRRPNSPENGK